MEEILVKLFKSNQIILLIMFIGLNLHRQTVIIVVTGDHVSMT